jgi:uncharacterized protein (TIGR03790 family)
MIQQGQPTPEKMPRMTSQSLLRRTLTLFLFLLAWPASASAGGGPENVLVIVNPRSPGSMHIANYYAKLRQIPDDNLVFVPWDPKADTTDIETFRQQILLPILRLIHNRRLGAQIDAIVYSSDFPWRISFHPDIPKFLPDPKVGEYLEELRHLVQSQAKPGEKPLWNKGEWSPLLGSVGSINGLTYLWAPVIGRRFDYAYLESNYYMRVPTADQRNVATVGFRGNRSYNAKGEVVATGGRRYFLSTMLGVTAGRGNSLAEVLKYLARSAAADGTHPKGTIYFVQNSDVRSTVRHAFFPQAVRDLTKLGVAAEILQGTVPLNRRNVQGVVMGTATFDWKASGSTILPGAICEHFTSYGGNMSSSSFQTPLSEFLRYGAAGASGAVVEPYTLIFKFPLPLIQVHYARGCTLAEAFYQSIYAPYQLLIVGDPLCRPWADIPQVSTKGVEPDASLRGRLTLEPSATLPKDAAVARFELFADGVRLSTCKPGETLSLDTTELCDGWHELRVVAVGPLPIESQGRQIIPVRLANRGRKIEASLVGDGPWTADKSLTIAVDSPGSIGVVAKAGNRVVGRITGEKGQIEIPANTLGAGPVRIRVTGLGKSGAITDVAATPINVTLQ